MKCRRSGCSVGRRLHHAPLADRLDDEGDVLVGLGVGGDDPHDAARLCPEPWIVGEHRPVSVTADRFLEIVDDRPGLSHLAPVGQQQHRDAPFRVEGAQVGGAELLRLRVAFGHREDGNAAVVGLEAGADQLDQRGRDAAAAQVERHAHRGAARRVAE